MVDDLLHQEQSSALTVCGSRKDRTHGWSNSEVPPNKLAVEQMNLSHRRKHQPLLCTHWTCLLYGSSSVNGRRLFREALVEGNMESYFRLAEQFRTQDDPAFCGLSTLTMVLNALAIDPGRIWKGIHVGVIASQLFSSCVRRYSNTVKRFLTRRRRICHFLV